MGGPGLLPFRITGFGGAWEVIGWRKGLGLPSTACAISPKQARWVLRYAWMKLRILAALVMTANWSVNAEQLVLRSEEHKFIWPLPQGWEVTQSLTKGQYAIKWQGKELMTIGLHVMTEEKTTMADLIKAHAANPRYLFTGIVQRFPKSTFISSSVVTIGSHDAIQTQCEYVMSNLDSKVRVFMCHFTIIWHGQMFSIAFECLPENREIGLAVMAKALAAFSFAD